MYILLNLAEWYFTVFLQGFIMLVALGFAEKRHPHPFITATFYVSIFVFDIIVTTRLWKLFGGSDLSYIFDPKFNDPIFLVVFLVTLSLMGILIFGLVRIALVPFIDAEGK